MKRLSVILILLTFSIVQAQEPVDHEVIASIKEEGIHYSQVMETLSYLADIYGPRFGGTPQYYEAAQWAETRLADWDLNNVKLENFQEAGRGWDVESYSVEMIAPRYMRVVAHPSSWSRSTNGEITGVPLVIDYNDLEVLEKHKGNLNGKILILVDYNESPYVSERGSGILSDDRLKQFSSYLGKTRDGREAKYIENKIAEEIKQDEEAKNSKPTIERKIINFLLEEGVAALIEPSSLNHGIVSISRDSYYRLWDPKPIAKFIVAKEHYGRIMRMLEKGAQPTLRLHSKTRFYEDPKYNVNVLADITGTDGDLKHEIVLIGAHLDSELLATGAADNGAGCAVMMEVMRILKAVGVKPRRTIRVGLWGGEEHFLYGSRGYGDRYLGNLVSKKFKKGQAEHSVYLNMDGGPGKIRGITMEGNEAVRPIFKAYLEPFAYLGANTITSKSDASSDQVVFDEYGIPSFNFLQDPEIYENITVHSNMDVVDLVKEDNLKQNAVIIATIVYHAAMRDEMFPRKRWKDRQ
jgi:carboxypeptidase Q